MYRELNVASFILLVIINVLSNIGQIGHGTNAQISAKYPTCITPAGFTFSIWGVIWFFQAAFVIMQALPFWKDIQTPYIQKISPFLSIGFLFQAAWTFAFSYEIMWLALLLIILAWVSLGVAYKRVKTLSCNLCFETEKKSCWTSFVIYCLYPLPTALNFAWLTVASIAMGFIFADAVHSTLGFNTTFGASMLVVSSLLALILQRVYVDVAPSMVIIWALLGISIGQTTLKTITTTCYICIGVLILTSILTIARNIRILQQNSHQRKLTYEMPQVSQPLTSYYY